MNVHWTDTAEDHLDAIYAYIAQDSPQYATLMVDRLTRRSQQIAKFPLSGRKVPEYEAVMSHRLTKADENQPHPHLNPLPDGEETVLLLPFKGRVRVGMGEKGIFR